MIEKSVHIFATRLKESRKNLGLTLEEFGRIGGVTPETQLSYESCRSNPNTKYLLRLMEHGIDIAYLLTGKVSELSDEEKLIIDLYRLDVKI